MLPTPMFRSLALPLTTEPAGTRRVLILALTVTGLAGGLSVVFAHYTTGAGYAASGSPPPPPTYMPTPIGPPPAHPTLTSEATAVITPSATASASSTAAPAATTVEAVKFSLDAARVAPVHNSGDLSGLVAVTPKSRVWLMMYLTVKSMPRKSSSLSTYVIEHSARLIMRASFGWTAAAHVTGRFSRFMPYTIPPQFSYGDHLTLKTTLKIGTQSQTKAWNFVIAKQQRFAATSSSTRGYPSVVR